MTKFIIEAGVLLGGDYANRAGDAENVSIWWRHHVMKQFIIEAVVLLGGDYANSGSTKA